ncbi:MAG: hypothetical protein M3198_10505 [Actinomycetota bacterium]|nr:hypothetical protein [Actinomycetota bacterium]
MASADDTRAIVVTIAKGRENDVDENTIRQHAEAHGQAVVAGDLRKASSDLNDEAKQQAPTVMKSLPRPTTSASVEDVTAEGDAFVARILYSGENSKATVASRWVEENGRPVIASLEIV